LKLWTKVSVFENASFPPENRIELAAAVIEHQFSLMLLIRFEMRAVFFS
jgi:hypothetical protein